MNSSQPLRLAASSRLRKTPVPKNPELRAAISRPFFFIGPRDRRRRGTAPLRSAASLAD